MEIEVTDHLFRPDDQRRPFPPGTIARIFQPLPPRPVPIHSGRQRWHLMLERPSSDLPGEADSNPVPEPLAQVELTFPTLASAIAYAERQGLPYLVEDHPPAANARTIRVATDTLPQFFRDALATYLLLAWWDAQYGRCAMPDLPGLEEVGAAPAQPAFA
ncbi:MAG TPA: hypothetical protein VNS22_10620 [Geminicoccus sp.]|uniref:hypothetical protein n=1 Tax=Geminicoccus sp. TaxID=2024832 RepID=UPI002BE023AA|nr:hypothetical protein [Geminicoccus sp.]HWL68824.1 hypothetical protein [Geminicoccus sp.]